MENDNEFFNGEAEAVNNLLRWYNEIDGVVPVDVLARAHELGLITENI